MKYDIDYDRWAEEKPFGLSGCIRLRDEEQFMEASVLSHEPWLDEVVLVTQPSKDKTEEMARDLAKAIPKVRVAHYDFDTAWIDTERFHTMDPNQPGHAVHMSNWALSQCRYSWIVKTEGDVIALPRFGLLRDWIELHPDEKHYYGWVLLNIAGINKTQISLDTPRNGGWDVAAFPNDPDYHFTKQSKWEMIKPPGEKTCMGIMGLHMKRCKKEFAFGWNDETYVPLTKEIVIDTIDRYNREYGYPGKDWRMEVNNTWDDMMSILAHTPKLMRMNLE